MTDQATRLRELAAAYRAQVDGTGQRRTKVIAITSGKGGVGKTNVSINIAQMLINSGKEVILLDADLGLANADILLGTVPPYHLGHLLKGERTIFELIHKTASRIKLIAGGSGISELVNLSGPEVQPFIRALAKLDGQADYLLLDTGAGISATVRQFVLAADEVLVVTTPEPTALADAYATIKMLVQHRPGIQMRLIINMAENLDEAAAAAERIIVTARNFLGLEMEHLGTVPRDAHVAQAVRQQTPFTLLYPGSPASRAVAGMVARLTGSLPPPDGTRPTPGFFDRLGSMFSRKAI